MRSARRPQDRLCSQARAAAVGTALLWAAALLVQPVGAFDPSSDRFGHRHITRLALENPSIDFCPEYIDIVLQANTDTDQWWAQLPAFARFHCDNEELGGCTERILALRREVVAKWSSLSCSSVDSLQEGLKFLGQALHTIQDFYSHSNWNNMVSGANPQIGTSRINATRSFRFCPTKKGVLGPNEQKLITTGYFEVAQGTGFCLDSARADGKCVHGFGYFCNGINKDKPDRPNYARAAAAALQSSYDFIVGILNEAGPEARHLLKSCGSEFNVVIDTSGSMGDDIAGVKAFAIARASSPQLKLRRFNLVWYTSSPTKLSYCDPQPFIDELAGKGTGGSIENLFGALIAAAEMATPGSTVFVFTDEDADDPSFRQAALDAVAAKRLKLLFLITNLENVLLLENEEEDAQGGPGLLAVNYLQTYYETLAADSGGRAIFAEKDEVSRVVQALEFSLSDQLTLLDRGSTTVEIDGSCQKCGLSPTIPVFNSSGTLGIDLLTVVDRTPALTSVGIASPAGDDFEAVYSSDGASVLRTRNIARYLIADASSSGTPSEFAIQACRDEPAICKVPSQRVACVSSEEWHSESGTRPAVFLDAASSLSHGALNASEGAPDEVCHWLVGPAGLHRDEVVEITVNALDIAKWRTLYVVNSAITGSSFSYSDEQLVATLHHEAPVPSSPLYGNPGEPISLVWESTRYASLVDRPLAGWDLTWRVIPASERVLNDTAAPPTTTPSFLAPPQDGPACHASPSNFRETLSGTSGVLTDGSAADAPYVEQFCRWLIPASASPDEVVVLRVKRYRGTFHAHLKIFAGDSVAEHSRLDAHSATVDPINVYEPKMRGRPGEPVTLFWNGDNQYPGSTIYLGWELEWNYEHKDAPVTDPCDEELAPLVVAGASGTLTDASAVDETYGVYLHCNWIITPPVVTHLQAIRVLFTRVDVDNARISLYLGHRKENRFITSFSTNDNAPVEYFGAPGESLSVSFQTFSSTSSGLGWTLDWSVVSLADVAPCLPNTPQLINLQLGAAPVVVKDSSLPDDPFVRYDNCKFLFQPPSDATHVSVVIDKIDVSYSSLHFAEGPADDRRDFLSTYQSSATNLTVVGLVGEDLYVYWEGRTGSGTGFQLSATAINRADHPACGVQVPGVPVARHAPHALSTATGTIADNRLPDVVYPPVQRCRWQIGDAQSLGENQVVQVNITKMNLATGAYNEYLRFFDRTEELGLELREIRRVSFDPSEHEMLWGYPGRPMVVSWDPTTTVDAPRWELDYAIVDNTAVEVCSRSLAPKVLRALSGTLGGVLAQGQSVNYAEKCLWVIQPPVAGFGPDKIIRLTVENGIVERSTLLISSYTPATYTTKATKTRVASLANVLPNGDTAVFADPGVPIHVEWARSSSRAVNWTLKYEVVNAADAPPRNPCSPFGADTAVELSAPSGVLREPTTTSSETYAPGSECEWVLAPMPPGASSWNDHFMVLEVVERPFHSSGADDVFMIMESATSSRRLHVLQGNYSVGTKFYGEFGRSSTVLKWTTAAASSGQGGWAFQWSMVHRNDVPDSVLACGGDDTLAVFLDEPHGQIQRSFAAGPTAARECSWVIRPPQLKQGWESRTPMVLELTLSAPTPIYSSDRWYVYTAGDAAPGNGRHGATLDLVDGNDLGTGSDYAPKLVTGVGEGIVLRWLSSIYSSVAREWSASWRLVPVDSIPTQQRACATTSASLFETSFRPLRPVFTASTGLLTDGSNATDPYAYGPECQWVIRPEGMQEDSVLQFTVDRLDLEPSRGAKLLLSHGLTRSGHEPDPDSIAATLASMTGGDAVATAGFQVAVDPFERDSEGVTVSWDSGNSHFNGRTGWQIRWEVVPRAQARVVTTFTATYDVHVFSPVQLRAFDFRTRRFFNHNWQSVLLSGPPVGGNEMEFEALIRVGSDSIGGPQTAPNVSDVELVFFAPSSSGRELLSEPIDIKVITRADNGIDLRLVGLAIVPSVEFELLARLTWNGVRVERAISKTWTPTLISIAPLYSTAVAVADPTAVQEVGFLLQRSLQTSEGAPDVEIEVSYPSNSFLQLRPHRLEAVNQTTVLDPKSRKDHVIFPLVATGASGSPSACPDPPTDADYAEFMLTVILKNTTTQDELDRARLPIAFMCSKSYKASDVNHTFVIPPPDLGNTDLNASVVSPAEEAPLQTQTAPPTPRPTPAPTPVPTTAPPVATTMSQIISTAPSGSQCALLEGAQPCSPHNRNCVAQCQGFCNIDSGASPSLCQPVAAVAGGPLHACGCVDSFECRQVAPEFSSAGFDNPRQSECVGACSDGSPAVCASDAGGCQCAERACSANADETFLTFKVCADMSEVLRKFYTPWEALVAEIRANLDAGFATHLCNGYLRSASEMLSNTLIGDTSQAQDFNEFAKCTNDFLAEDSSGARSCSDPAQPLVTRKPFVVKLSFLGGCEDAKVQLLLNVLTKIRSGETEHLEAWMNGAGFYDISLEETNAPDPVGASSTLAPSQMLLMGALYPIYGAL